MIVKREPTFRVWVPEYPKSSQAERSNLNRYKEVIGNVAKEVVPRPTNSRRLDIEIFFQAESFLRPDVDNVIKPILDALREGNTIALVNIKPLKDKDLVELKRAINKIKKTCDAIDGDIAGFGEDWIAVVPSFAHIHRATAKKEEVKEGAPQVTEYRDDE